MFVDADTYATGTPSKGARKTFGATYADKPWRIYAGGLKRVFDIAFALAISPIALPLIAILWALVRIEGKPAIYAHLRVGKDGHLFQCYKLRTMKLDADAILARLCAEDPDIAAEWHTYQKLENDPRITQMGRFLRATSLDELPQLWNVITGDMSFVGPRPYTPDQETMYENAGGRAYRDMRPGITGIWQVEGRSATTFIDRARFDNDYGVRQSLALDLSLIVRTVGVVFAKTGR
ncbi:sugar transferase [Celeribacter marinus]|uniref:sugar transferase n=1 Tax=Celeribacter marinus TaxID=1397108 RepID=UPI003F6CBAC6